MKETAFNSGTLIGKIQSDHYAEYDGGYEVTLSEDTQVLATRNKRMAKDLVIHSKPEEGHKQKDVNFYDYDGSIVNSYTIQEAQALKTLPDGPAHDGLTFQGWNYSIASVNALTRPADIGAMYITDDGKTRFHFRMESLARPTVQINFTATAYGGVTIDWGDGTTEQSVETDNTTYTHEYTTPGDHTITLEVLYGNVSLVGDGVSSGEFSAFGGEISGARNILKSVEIGAGVTSIGNYAFRECNSLSGITIPNGVTVIGEGAFYNCYSLSNVTIPNSVSGISRETFYCCYSLRSATLPDSIKSIGYESFYDCVRLRSITIPDGCLVIEDEAFSYCYSLSSIIIPGSVSRIGYEAFYSCYALSSVIILDGVTNIGESAFDQCYALRDIIIPNGVTGIGDNAFMNCNALSNVTIPDGVTSIGVRAFYNCSAISNVTIPGSVTSIGDRAFNYCYSLSSITIPGSVASIGAWAFSRCAYIKEYHFLATTPPALSDKNAFEYNASDFIIYVPVGCLNAYKTATNWSTYAARMQEEQA